MSDYFNLSNISPGSLAEKFESSEQYAVGSLRRKYNFGDKVNELMISQDPFFALMSKVAKQPTDDPVFKFTERRGSWHKRYAYPVGFSNDGSTWVEDVTGDLTTQLDTYETVGNTVYVKMAGDYLNSGNIQNVYGNATGNNITIGMDGTAPQFYIPGLTIRINFCDDTGGTTVDSYAVCRVESVTMQDASATPVTSHANCDAAVLRCTVVKAKAAGDDYVAGLSSAARVGDTVATSSIHSTLEPTRSYVMGSAFGEGTGYPETWKDQPFSTEYGYTQIWKTAMAMTNTARATRMRYEPNEWARIWKEHMIGHKWDIEQSMLFGHRYADTTNGINYTQGAVDYISTYGNLFSWTTAKTADDFLDDMSNFCDPRYNNLRSTVFMVSTHVYNWMYKLGGYFKNNLELSTNFRADLAITGRKKVLGLDMTTIYTNYGNINMVRNIHLDGSPVKILAIDLNSVKYRPLVGNGLNRDTSVYVGVQTLENSGVDRRVDLILTEAGMQWMFPEKHAAWLG